MKIPVPMIAPTPRAVSCAGPRILRRRFSPFISSSSKLSGFVANKLLAIQLNLQIDRFTFDLFTLRLQRVFRQTHPSVRLTSAKQSKQVFRSEERRVGKEC